MAGYEVFIIDNLCNSKLSVLDRIQRITGRKPGFSEVDVRDRTALRQLFKTHAFDAAIHFAGLKAVGESVARPLLYYDNNVGGSVALFGCMMEAGLKSVVFSSSATVYGDPHTVPVREDFPMSPQSPYARTKLMIEEILRDIATSDPTWHIALLRYFNPVGAHSSGLIGEDPQGIPNNLMPYAIKVAAGNLPQLAVFGDDYETPDGTGVRDYIHVVDLALGHVAALRAFDKTSGVMTLNLGTGKGHSVLDVVRALAAASGRKVPYQVVSRRSGDVAEYYADPTLAREVLGWQATRGIDEMCADSWRWQSRGDAG